MNGLLSGLEKFGLGKLNEVEVYAKDEKELERERQEHEKKVPHQTEEREIVFDKTYRCVVCNREFKNKTVMTGKAKLVSVDTDLRPRYQGIDCIKYDTIVCPYCGYGALTRFYGGLTPGQTKLVKENICYNFTSIRFGDETYSYDDAIIRYQLCLAGAVVKRSKISERAYACLKLAWIFRGKAEALDEEAPDYPEILQLLQEEEQKYIQSAYDGFIEAMATERFPLCGMDEFTYTYVTADLARRCKDYKNAVKLVSHLLTAKGASSKVKERTRELREMIKQEVKDNNIEL